MTSELTSQPADSIAVAIHAFYPDILDEIINLLGHLPGTFKYYVTATKDHEKRIVHTMRASGRDYLVHVVENRGRDILPFLAICPRIKEDGFRFVLKLHTKRSPQFKNRDEWRQDVLRKLLSPDAFARAWEVMRDDRSLGILCPEGYYLPLSTHMGPNRSRVLSIGARLGLGEADILRQGFVAGSMFMARLEALQPLLNLGFHAADFEPEAGRLQHQSRICPSPMAQVRPVELAYPAAPEVCRSKLGDLRPAYCSGQIPLRFCALLAAESRCRCGTSIHDVLSARRQTKPTSCRPAWEKRPCYVRFRLYLPC